MESFVTACIPLDKMMQDASDIGVILNEVSHSLNVGASPGVFTYKAIKHAE